MAKREQRRGAEIFMEGGGNLHEGGRKSLKRGAEIIKKEAEIRQKFRGGAQFIGFDNTTSDNT